MTHRVIQSNVWGLMNGKIETWIKGIFRYIRAMQSRHVKFDYTQEDKSLFYAVLNEIGSEKAFLQQVANNGENLVVLSKEDVLRIECSPLLFYIENSIFYTLYCIFLVVNLFKERSILNLDF